MGVKYVAARLNLSPKFSPKTQSNNLVAINMLERADFDPTFMMRIVTGDETWFHKFDLQTSQQASEWLLVIKLNPEK